MAFSNLKIPGKSTDTLHTTALTASPELQKALRKSTRTLSVQGLIQMSHRLLEEKWGRIWFFFLNKNLSSSTKWFRLTSPQRIHFRRRFPICWKSRISDSTSRSCTLWYILFLLLALGLRCMVFVKIKFEIRKYAYDFREMICLITGKRSRRSTTMRFTRSWSEARARAMDTPPDAFHRIRTTPMRFKIGLMWLVR